MTDDVTRSVLTRVKKLLNLTVERGATPEEAASAAAKAQALLFEHNLKLADVEGVGEESEYVLGEIDLNVRGKFHVNWHRRLLTAIARYNFCRMIVLSSGTKGSGKKGAPEQCVIVGRPHNIEFVIWLYRSVSTQIADMSKVAMRRYCEETLPGPQGAWTREFCYGAVVTIANRLWAQRERDKAASAKSTALVRVSDVKLQDAFNRYFPPEGRAKASTESMKDYGGYIHGKEAGKSVSLGRPLPRSERAELR